MLHFLPAPLLGLLSGTLIILNTLFWFLVFIPLIVIKPLLFHRALQNHLSRFMMNCAQSWCYINSGIMWLTQKTRWEITGTEHLDLQKSYFVISNHYSWTDIFALQHVLKGRIPFLKFFIKRELIWVPMLGVVWWAMDMPFMKRYSQAYLEKHPEKRGKDIETTVKSCEKFKDYPVSVINFLEGTRFREDKHRKQNSPYRFLLRPKAGGAALALSVMGETLHQVIDVTLCYPDNTPERLFWGLLSGKIPRIVAHVRALPVPENVAGYNYLEDEAYRQRIQDWVNTIWQEKDAILARIHESKPTTEA